MAFWAEGDGEGLVIWAESEAGVGIDRREDDGDDDSYYYSSMRGPEKQQLGNCRARQFPDGSRACGTSSGMDALGRMGPAKGPCSQGSMMTGEARAVNGTHYTTLWVR